MARAAIDFGRKDAAGAQAAGAAAVLVEALLVILLAGLAARALWASYPPALDAGSNGVARFAPSAGPVSPAAPRGQNPFRRGDPVLAELDADLGIDAPITSLNLTVVGLRSSKAERGGAAIIRTPDGRQKRYKVGDTIVDGAVLHRVEDERLLIRRAGVIEALPLRTATTTLVSNAAGASISRRPSAGAVEAAEGDDREAIATNPTTPTKVGASAPQVDIKALIEGLSPRVSADGAAIEIYPRGDARAFASAGFERGDVLRSINGQTVVPGTDLARLFSNLSRASSVTAIVSRAGTERTIKFEVEQE